MSVKKAVALIAHDQKKDDLADFARSHQKALSRFPIVATGTTGSRIAEACPDLEIKRLKSGPLVDMAEKAGGVELWLDGGHNAAAGLALADLLKTMPPCPTHLICGMLNTKDVTGYMHPLAAVSDSLTAISIPGEANTLPAEATAEAARSVGLETQTAQNATAALSEILSKTSPDAPRLRVLICGSLYLAGSILRENG